MTVKPAFISYFNKFSRRFMLLTLVFMLLSFVHTTHAVMAEDNNRVIIYSSAEDYRNAHFLQRLNEQFPDYDIVIEYMPTGNSAVKLQAEGASTPCDILLDMEYGYFPLLENLLADISHYDQSVFMEDMRSPSGKYLPMYRNGGAVILNLDVLAQHGLREPASYEDLLDEQYHGFISMPNPKSSGTGYMFLKSLVNAWGEDEAFDYFDALSENILQFTSSGSGPVNALVQGEAAIGLGMTGQAVVAMNQGANLKILYFEEGSPCSLYGYAMIEGKQHRQCVRDVFDFFYTTLVDEDKALFFPEQIYTNKQFAIPGYPTDIPYADMSGNTTEEKMRLLNDWEY